MVSFLDILYDHIKTHNEIKIDSRYLFDEHRLLNADTLLVKYRENLF